MSRLLLIAMALLTATIGQAQEFTMKHVSDSLSMLILRTDSMLDRWEIRHPVYRFCTGDVNCDGQQEALVGVVSATRFYPEQGRRLFIYKNVRGRIRSLWMGSRLGGILQDFRYVDGCVRSLETDNHGRYYVAEYSLRKFGLGFDRFLAEAVGRDEALTLFESP